MKPIFTVSPEICADAVALKPIAIADATPNANAFVLKFTVFSFDE
jgi:hypothetical protein